MLTYDCFANNHVLVGPCKISQNWLVYDSIQSSSHSRISVALFTAVKGLINLLIELGWQCGSLRGTVPIFGDTNSVKV